MTTNPETRAARRLRNQMHSSGLYTGSIRKELACADDASATALLDEAARTGQTLAKVLVTRWSEEWHRRAR